AQVAVNLNLDQIDMEYARKMAEDAREQVRDAEEQMRAASKAWASAGSGWGAGFGSGNMAFNYNFSTPMAFAQGVAISAGARRGMNDDNLYNAGLRALDNHR